MTVSAWFKNLSDVDRQRLSTTLAMAADQTLFGLLAVLDGARAIESTPEKGEFSLIFKKDGVEWDLLPREGVPLHEVLGLEPGWFD